MLTLWLLLGTSACAQAPDLEPEHRANLVFASLVSEGFEIDGKSRRWSAPLLKDGQTAEAQRAAMRTLVANDREVDELLRNSVTAPQVVKVRDEPAHGSNLLRAADAWFVVHADLRSIDPEKAARAPGKTEPVEVGNMRFSTALLEPADIKAAGLPDSKPGQEWFVHSESRLLDRIHVESTDQAFLTRSEESVVVATRTSRAFDRNERFGNRWWPIKSERGRDQAGKSEVYAGGAGYVKISKLKLKEGALLVEAHFTFAEPKAWFDGAPILRSKLVLVAQDQVRRLRRDLAKGGPGSTR
jgi:hypothetical protein